MITRFDPVNEQRLPLGMLSDRGTQVFQRVCRRNQNAVEESDPLTRMSRGIRLQPQVVRRVIATFLGRSKHARRCQHTSQVAQSLIGFVGRTECTRKQASSSRDVFPLKKAGDLGKPRIR